MSLLSTALSFFITPVCDDLGFGRGSFTLYYSLMVAMGAVSASFLANPVWGMVYDTFGTYSPALMAMPILLVCAALALISAFRSHPKGK